MHTMQLQQALQEDFNTHEIVVNESYIHVHRNGVLKADFDCQMAEMLKRIKAAKKVAQSACCFLYSTIIQSYFPVVTSSRT